MKFKTGMEVDLFRVSNPLLITGASYTIFFLQLYQQLIAFLSSEWGIYWILIWAQYSLIAPNTWVEDERWSESKGLYVHWHYWTAKLFAGTGKCAWIWSPSNESCTSVGIIGMVYSGWLTGIELLFHYLMDHYTNCFRLYCTDYRTWVAMWELIWFRHSRFI